MGLYRVIIKPVGGGRFEHSLPSGGYVFGREADSCDIPIASPEISRRHVQLTFTEEHCTVSDLGSASGTTHEGELLHDARNIPYPFELTLGACKLSVEQDENTKSFRPSQLDSAAGTKISGSPSEATPASSPAAPAGHYTQGKLLAKGGMGAVMEAKDQLLGRTVAMKVILPDIGSSESMRLRFIREASVLARLEHPGIVPIYEMGKDADGELFYAMKKVEGRTLQAILDDLRKSDEATVREFTIDRLLTIFRKICDAMAFAHSREVIHRDLKPENVMVGSFGEVLVMDWGLAKVMNERSFAGADNESESPQSEELSGATQIAEPLSDDSDWLDDMVDESPEESAELTLAGSVMGSPQYMPPEQAEGRLDRIDPRSDVYALGAVLYSILTLRPPVNGRSVAEVLARLKSGQILPPSDFDVGGAQRGGGRESSISSGENELEPPLPHYAGGKVPSALSAVAMKALSFDQADRYQTVRDLSSDVEAYQKGFSTSAEQAGVLALALLFIKRHKGIAISTGVAALLLAAVTIGFLYQVKTEQALAEEEALNARTAEKAESAAKDLALQRERETREALAASTLALAESAYRGFDLAAMTRALAETPEESRDSSWRYLADKKDSSLGEFHVPGMEDITTGVALPGMAGQFLLAGNSGVIRTVDVRGPETLRKLNSGIGGAKHLAISGDGKRVALGPLQGREVSVFELSRRTLIRKIPLAKGAKLKCLALDHEGRRLAIGHAVKDSDGGLSLYAMDREKPLWSVRKGTPGDVFLHPNGELVLACNYYNRCLQIYSASNGRLRSNHNHQVQSMAPNADGSKIALGCMLGTVVIVDSETGQKIQSGRLHEGTIVDLAWLAGDTLATVGVDGSAHRIALWNGDDFSSLGFLFGLETKQRNQDIVLDPAGGYLLSLRDEPRLWRAPMDIEIGKIDIRCEQALKASFVSDTTLLAGLLWSTAAYDVSTPSDPKLIGPGKLGPGHPISASHWGTGLFAVGSRNQGDSSILLHRMENGLPRLLWSKVIGENVRNLDFDPAGERLMVGSVGPNLRIVSTADGETLQSFKAPAGLFIGKEGSRMAALFGKNRQADRADDEVGIMELATGSVVHRRGWKSRLNCIAVSIEQNLVAVAGGEQRVILLDGDTLEVKNSFRAHDRAVTALAFHPALPIVASGAGDGSVKLWDIRTGSRKELFMGIRGIPISLVFSPNGRLLAVQGKERMVRLFDVSHLGNEEAVRTAAHASE